MPHFYPKCILFLIIILGFYFKSRAQNLPDYQWWADAHNWDGITHWSRYIKRLPGYMGPNALPIPAVGNAKTSEAPAFNIAGEYHSGIGEFAVNPYLNLEIPVVRNKVSLNFLYRPFEYYETEEFIRFERYGRNQDCRGFAKSDLYVGTHIQLLNQKEKPFDAMMRIVLKTTTGKDLANGRHTDAPGYHFDINLGKTIYKNGRFFKKINLYSMTGLYVWQMEFDNNRQNDAFLYGLRSDFEMEPLTLGISFSGFSGYMNIRDRPMALRYDIVRTIKQTSLCISYQQGLRDVIKHSVRIGLAYNFKHKSNG